MISQKKLEGVIIGHNAFFRVPGQHINFTVVICCLFKGMLNMTHILQNNYTDLGNRV